MQINLELSGPRWVAILWNPPSDPDPEAATAIGDTAAEALRELADQIDQLNLPRAGDAGKARAH
jgi:hypothetical protein